MFDKAIRWLFGSKQKAKGLRLRNIGPILDDTEVPDEVAELPVIHYGKGIYAYFKSDDLLFPENQPQLSISDVVPRDAESLEEQITHIINEGPQ